MTFLKIGGIIVRTSLVDFDKQNAFLGHKDTEEHKGRCTHPCFKRAMRQRRRNYGLG